MRKTAATTRPPITIPATAPADLYQYCVLAIDVGEYVGVVGYIVGAWIGYGVTIETM
jgi:hypothetical protein